MKSGRSTPHTAKEEHGRMKAENMALLASFTPHRARNAK